MQPLLTAVIAGLFTLLGVWLKDYLERRRTSEAVREESTSRRRLALQWTRNRLAIIAVFLVLFGTVALVLPFVSKHQTPTEANAGQGRTNTQQGKPDAHRDSTVAVPSLKETSSQVGKLQGKRIVIAYNDEEALQVVSVSKRVQEAGAAVTLLPRTSYLAEWSRLDGFHMIQYCDAADLESATILLNVVSVPSHELKITHRSICSLDYDRTLVGDRPALSFDLLYLH